MHSTGILNARLLSGKVNWVKETRISWWAVLEPDSTTV